MVRKEIYIKEREELLKKIARAEQFNDTQYIDMAWKRIAHLKKLIEGLND